MGIHEGEFGTCCDDLAECMNRIPEPFFRVEGRGVLFLTVGYVETEDGTGWFDHAVIYCPFCGRRLQDPASLPDASEDE